MALDTFIIPTLASITAEYLTVKELIALDLVTPAVLRNKLPPDIGSLMARRDLDPVEYDMISAYVMLNGVPREILAHPQKMVGYPSFLVKLILDRMPTESITLALTDPFPDRYVSKLKQQAFAETAIEYMLAHPQLNIDRNKLIREAQAWHLDTIVNRIAPGHTPLEIRDTYRLTPYSR